MDTAQAAALLAALEAEHGDGVLAALLGAAFRKERLAQLEAETDLGTQLDELASNGEESRDWCAAFCETDAFWAAAGMDDAAVG